MNIALNSTVRPSSSSSSSSARCRSSTSAVTWPPPASSAQYPAFAAAATICGSTVVGVMPANRIGGLPVSSLNFVAIRSPAGVWMTRGRYAFQFCRRSGSPVSVDSAARSAVLAASTTPAPLPWASAATSLPAVVPGPISTIHNADGSVDSSSLCTRPVQSTWLISTSSASSRARSPSKPHACAQATVWSTASAISGEWNGNVTSRYSSVGSNTEPPRTFCSRRRACLRCSLPAASAKSARSSGYPDRT